MTVDEIRSKVSNNQLVAAHALNLCMVSVSQIVDYQDLVIMDQEYEGILNNLNLENISKDKALLDVLKQILDVITYFRIQEGDKALIEREYRQKMKNALWNAIPSPTMLVTTNPAGLMLSLATMIGTGYMNYRKAKAENSLSLDRELWQLQRSAIEQLNGLRRELFSAAWQFADHYDYPDELRLTERQIRHYNEILMDSNLIRKYQRLDAIKEAFFAYPPFWYQLGNAANQIYRVSDPDLWAQDKKHVSSKYNGIKVTPLEISLDEASREKFKEDAERYFEIYWEINQSPLLREDPTASACALEYADLLIEDHAEKNKILELIRKAVRFAGNSNDVLQLCAIAYIQLGQTHDAIALLKILVNEEYNTELNAQILSGQFIAQYSDGTDPEEKRNAHAEYQLLQSRMGSNKKDYLLPWPSERGMDNNVFLLTQKEHVKRKYESLIEEIEERATVRFERLLLGPDPYKEYDDHYFSEPNRKNRLDQMNSVFNIKEKRDEYIEAICTRRIAFDIITLYNELYEMILSFEWLTDASKRTLITMGRKKLESKGEELYSIQNRMSEKSFAHSDYLFLEAFLAEGSRRELFDFLRAALDEFFQKSMQMNTITNIESGIYTFCRNNKIPEPVIKYEEESLLSNVEPVGNIFEIGLLGTNAETKQKIAELTAKMANIIQDYSVKISDGRFVKWLIKGTKDFNGYFTSGKVQGIEMIQEDAIAILDDMSILDGMDLIFGRTCLTPISKGKIVEDVLYKDVVLNEQANEMVLSSKTRYKNKRVNLVQLYQMIMKLNEIIFESGE